MAAPTPPRDDATAPKARHTIIWQETADHG
jgi:hypothetical protein